MPTNIKYFRDFSKGLISNIDPNDLPDEAVYSNSSYHSQNFKMDSIGKITAINDLETVIEDHAEPFYNSGWLSRSSGIYDLIYSRSGVVKQIEDFYSDPDVLPNILYSTSGFTGNAIAQNNSLHIGSSNGGDPIYIGEVNNYIFQGRAKATPILSSLNDALYVDTENVETSSTKTIRIQIATTAGEIQENVSWSSNGSTVTITPEDMAGFTNGDTVNVSNSEYSYQYRDNTETSNIDGSYTISNTTSTTFDITGVTILSPEDIYNQKCDIREGNVPEFKYSENSGGTWSSNQAITKFQKYNLDDITYTGSGYGLKIWFNSVSGLNAGDKWDILLYPTDNTVIGESAVLNNYGLGNVPIVTVSPMLSYGSTENFNPDKRHYIAYSFEYDGSQTSPLYWDETQTIIPTTSNPETLTINITIDNSTAEISKRINAISLWHAESATNIAEPETYFRLIKRIETNNDKWRYTSNADIVTNVVENTGYFGASYNATTGILDTAKDILPKYKLSAPLNGCLFVGDFSHPWFKHQDGMIIAKSQLGSYEMFNLTEDILKLPEVPTCLYPYRGKLLAFTESKMYTINYDMYIEDIYNGVGCSSLHTITETEEGLYIANDKALYKLASNGVEEVSFPIRNLWITPTWLIYDATEKMIMVGDNATYRKYGYDIDRKSWTSLYFSDEDIINSAFEGKYQDSYIMGEHPKVYKCFAGSPLTFTIYKPIVLNTPTEYKKWYELLVNGSINTKQFREESIGSTWTNLTDSVEVKVSGSWSKSKILWIKVTGTELDEIAIKFRQLLGVRT